MLKTIVIQPKEREDMTLPYPYHIDASGEVGRQDFWKGKPKKLVGFAASPMIHEVVVNLKSFLKKPKLAIGMFPIFEQADGQWYTYTVYIESISVREKAV